MKYTVTIKKSVAKVMETLPTKLVKPITSAIISLADNPRPNGCKKLKGKHTNFWRIRVGDFRVIYIIDDEIKIVDIQEVGHRKDVYD